MLDNIKKKIASNYIKCQIELAKKLLIECVEYKVEGEMLIEHRVDTIKKLSSAYAVIQYSKVTKKGSERYGYIRDNVMGDFEIDFIKNIELEIMNILKKTNEKT